MIDIPKRIFITGTDTGVGKTVVTAALASCLVHNGQEVNIIKPFQTGVDAQFTTDIEFVYRVLNREYDFDSVCPFRLEKPLSPFYASRIEGISYNMSEVIDKLESSFIENTINIVEGAGGIRVPITEQYFMDDLAKDLNLELVIVCRPGLGTVNHTLLTIDYARSRGLEVFGIVVSNFPYKPDLAESTNISQISELTDAKIIGIIPEIEGLDVEKGQTGKLGEKSTEFFVNRLGGNLNTADFLT